MNCFKWPWALTAILLLPYLGWRLRHFRDRAPAVLFPSAGSDVSRPRSLRERWIRFPQMLRLIAIALLIAAGAGPVWNQRPSREIANSIGIQILVDRSSSMERSDMLYEGRQQSRLEVVKRLSHNFIFGDGRDLRGRPSDMIGLIAFAADPITLCPLTLSHELLQPALSSLRVAEGDQDGTAIGDAVALAAARFELADREHSGHLKSKVIILLTDGENNLGARSVSEAAALAHQWGVRIYPIAIRPTTEGDSEPDIVGELEILSLQTKGSARVASDGSALRSIYSEINRLENTDVGTVTLEPQWGAFRFLVFASLVLLAVEVLMNQTWLRRIP
jgi:Ca-activated chloride channel family protein